MHSRIFQIETAPVDKKAYIMTGDFEDGFVGQVADYVADSDNREEDIRWLIGNFESVANENDLLIGSSLIDYNPSDSSIIFKTGFKEAYFKKKFDQLQNTVAKLTLKEFSDNGYTIYQIEKLLGEKFGFYVQMTDCGYQTVDEFIRENVKENQKYYFGNTLDYHS
jgi:hypothetical protein